MMKEVAIEIIEPSAFDFPDAAHFVNMHSSAEANQTNARIPTDVFVNRRDMPFTVLGFPRRDPIATLRTDRHFSASEIRLPSVTASKLPLSNRPQRLRPYRRGRDPEQIPVSLT